MTNSQLTPSGSSVSIPFNRNRPDNCCLL